MRITEGQNRKIASLTPLCFSHPASNSYSSSYTPDKAIDGNAGSWWSSRGFASQWIQLDLGQAANLNKVRLLVNQDPSGQTTHQIYGGADSNNLSLLGTLTGSTVENQWLELASAATNVRYVKVVTTSSPSWVGWREIEVYGTLAGSGSAPEINWLVTDQLGTPRLIFDKTGSLAKRHDYLPFGEEMFAGSGGRTTTQGYSGSDGVRQKFTKYERDNETGLDYAKARYYANSQGRFTSPDPLMASGRTATPQSCNRYTYCINKPLILIDPNGLD